MQIMEVIRLWQAGEGARAIARATGLARNTVDKYLRLAVAAGVKQGGEPPGEALYARLVTGSRPGPKPGAVATPGKTLLRGQQERIGEWIDKEHLQLTRVHELLLADNIAVSYTTLREFVQEAGLWKAARTTLRMADWPPGEAAEMDFGKLGRIMDAATGRKRTLWALVIVLLHSRHQFVWPMFHPQAPQARPGDPHPARPTRPRPCPAARLRRLPHPHRGRRGAAP